jgi:hypothetical protein
MKSSGIGKKLIFIALTAATLAVSGCGTVQNASRNTGADSSVTISRGEYDLMKKLADERYIFVEKRTFDSLLNKTKALEEVNRELVKHLPEERRAVNTNQNDK